MRGNALPVRQINPGHTGFGEGPLIPVAYSVYYHSLADQDQNAKLDSSIIEGLTPGATLSQPVSCMFTTISYARYNLTATPANA